MVVILAVDLPAGCSAHPPARRGKQRIEPRTPAGIHMPGPSFAPILAAIGAFLLFLGLVFGGPLLFLGAIALALTLLYWLAEAVRIYDHDIGDDCAGAAGRRPRRPAAGRPHARPVVPAVPRRGRRRPC